MFSSPYPMNHRFEAANEQQQHQQYVGLKPFEISSFPLQGAVSKVGQTKTGKKSKNSSSNKKFKSQGHQQQHSRKKSNHVLVVTAKSRENLADKAEKGIARLEVGGIAQHQLPKQLIRPLQGVSKTGSSTRKAAAQPIASEKAVMNTVVNNLFNQIIEKPPAENETLQPVQSNTVNTNLGRPPTANRSKTVL